MAQPRFLSLSLALVLAAGAAGARAATVAPARNAAGQEVIVFENNLIKLAVLPSKGARISSFVYKPRGVEMLKDPVMSGLLVDHFREQYFPGELWGATYQAKLVQTGPEVVSATFSYAVTGAWEGSETPDLKGLVIEKMLTLREGSPVLEAHYAVRNPTATGKAMSFWSQHLVWPGGKADPINYYRPSRRGVKVIFDQPDMALRDKMEEVIRDPAAGWMAALDTQTHDGLVWVMDYNTVEWLYNCAGSRTVEWFCTKAAIPAGKAWETDIAIYPVYGMNGFATCSRALATDCQVNREGARFRLTHQVASVDPACTSAAISGSLLNPITNATAPVPESKLSPLTFEPQNVEVEVPAAPPDPLVVRLDATAAGATQHYELWAGGAYGDNWQLQGGPVYSMPPPARQTQYLKPDRIALTLGPQPRALLARGLYSPSLKLEESLKTAGFAEVRVAYHRVGLWGTTSLLGFPMSYDELLTNHLIVLADVDAEALGDVGREMLKDYVAAGGGLMVFGGPYAFGEGGYDKAQMAEILPVKVSGLFDVVRGDFELSPGAGGPVTAGLAWPEQPVAPYLHRLTPKDGAEVVVHADKLPFVVAGTYGKGKVVCVAGQPVGQSAGHPLFWLWSGWPELVQRLALWAQAPPK